MSTFGTWQVRALLECHNRCRVILRHGMGMHGMAWHGRGMAWHGMAWTQHDMTEHRHGMKRMAGMWHRSPCSFTHL